MGLLRVKSASELVRMIINKDMSYSSVGYSLEGRDCQDDSKHVLIHQECILAKGDESNKNWESIPEYSKTDLLVGKHLGRGTFSDVFEVTAVEATQNEKTIPEFSNKDDLGMLIETQFAKFEPLSGREETTKKNNESLSASDLNIGVARMATKDERDNTASVFMDTLPSSSRPTQKRRMTHAMKCLRPQVRSDAERFKVGIDDLVHETSILASLEHPNIVKVHGRMACYGGGVGSVAGSFHVSNGYFILLDRLTNTLEERIECWRKMSSDKKAPPSLTQAKTAYSIADAVSYLHSKNIIFPDPKPSNIGFDSKGELKLFDFGFAADTSKSSSSKASYLMYDQCGTMRYMAPEVGLQLGHSFPADVYSFGVLLWEMFALKRPYGDVKLSAEFYRMVFEKGTRPKLKKYWPQDLKNLMEDCWARSPNRRPRMDLVKTILSAYVHDLSSMEQEEDKNQNGKVSSLRRVRSSIF